MEQKKNFYECLFIVNPTVGDEIVKETVNKFITLISENGTIVESAEWGRRKMAYPINDIPEGYYVIVYFESESDFPAELERKFGIDEAILRSLVIKPDTRKVSTAAPVERFERTERPPRRFEKRYGQSSAAEDTSEDTTEETVEENTDTEPVVSTEVEAADDNTETGVETKKAESSDEN